MLRKGTKMKDFIYSYLDKEPVMWYFIRAVDFNHAAKALYRSTRVSGYTGRIQIRLTGSSKPIFEAPVYELKDYF